MKRPFLLRLLPPRLRGPAYYRLYRKQRQEWPDLYTKAPLHHAPSIRMKLSAGDEGHASVAFTGFYELDLSKQLSALAKEGGLLVDVGANYGYFSLIWAAAAAKNRVISFEASPRNIGPLRLNIETNQLSERIELRPRAVGQAPGRMSFGLGPEEQTGWGGLGLHAQSQAQVEVEVCRLDDELPGEIRIKALKIDIEGADTWAILGAARLLREKRIEHLFYEEFHLRMQELGIEPGTARRFLEQQGYRVELMGKGDADFAEFHAYLPGR